MMATKIEMDRALVVYLKAEKQCDHARAAYQRARFEDATRYQKAIEAFKKANLARQEAWATYRAVCEST